MRIMMLSWEYPPRIVGGIARVVHDLSHAFAKQGHEVHVITYQEGETKEFEKDGPVFVHRVTNYPINANNLSCEKAIANGNKKIVSTSNTKNKMA